ncbi:aldehyde dehydrogenase family protein [Ramlibacter sp. AW1]|uniref:4-(hydroxymethyl)benzenesulfonate dehydrogenase n=1 Tax=Ramlibacter aurantiacus TaxID=2801330 RepID=A0A937D470_9BURK|nr:aldehyde dehydrogenase family protein [Ramlibacter aurantiacus]MBL0420037.1 aldehyde dehydrogenase family protein [Ramlibacter aurantiacus]
MHGDNFDPDRVDLPSGCLIGGERVPGDGTVTEVRRPSDGKLARAEAGASASLVDRAVTEARHSLKSSGWAEMEPRQRMAIMRRWADLVDAHADELAQLEATVSVRVVSSVRLRDVPMTAEMIRFYGECIDKIEGAVLATRGNRFSTLVREPYGVVAAISPWNTPMLLATLKIAPALAAGNAVVLKPSEFTPYAILRVAELGLQAGLPRGILSILPGTGAETGTALVRHPGVDYVAFTGSASTGARVMCDAATSGLKPVSLELGGKSPQLVFADAPDLDAVATLVAASVCANGGQVCFAGTRLVVEASVADQLVERIAARMDRMQAGPTWDGATTLAPIVSPAQMKRLESLLDAAEAAGARRLHGGGRIDPGLGGLFYAPTILGGMADDNPAVREELFGPVLAVQTFQDLEQGLRLADHPSYGLAGGVHTRDIAKALKAARAIQAGTVWVNHYGPNTDPNQPMGGYKQSGFGKDFGVMGLEKFLKTKNIAFQI